MSRANQLAKLLRDNMGESLDVRGPVANDPAPAPIPMAGEGPEEGRKTFGEGSLEQLAQSLKTTGQLQPIRVRWIKPHGKWVIISGERRYLAAIRAGFKSIACQFVDQELSETKVRQQSLIENLLREDLRPIEAAHGYRQLMDL
jgi:ParB family chromosome partitioning protein